MKHMALSRNWLIPSRMFRFTWATLPRPPYAQTVQLSHEKNTDPESGGNQVASLKEIKCSLHFFSVPWEVTPGWWEEVMLSSYLIRSAESAEEVYIQYDIKEMFK